MELAARIVFSRQHRASAYIAITRLSNYFGIPMIYTQAGSAKSVTIVGLGEGDVYLRCFEPTAQSEHGIAFINTHEPRYLPPPPLSWWARFRRSQVGIGIFGPIPRDRYISDRGSEREVDSGIVQPADVEIQFQDLTAIDVLIGELQTLRHAMWLDITEPKTPTVAPFDAMPSIVSEDADRAPIELLPEHEQLLQQWHQEHGNNKFLFPESPAQNGARDTDPS